MRRICILFTSFVTSFILLLTALGASPARANGSGPVLPADGTYECTTGEYPDPQVREPITYTVTAGEVSNGFSCEGTVVIADGVTSIGAGAFESSALTSITIPTSVTSIGIGAFQYAYALTSITIPASVNLIGEYAFDGAYALATVTFAEGSALTSIPSFAFNETRALSSITIPARVDSIGMAAFRYAPLTSIYFLGDAPTLIGWDQFYYLGTTATVYITPTAAGFSSGQVPRTWNSIVVKVLPIDGTYECSTGFKTDEPEYTGTYTITINGSLATVSLGDTCEGAVVIADGVTAIGDDAFYGAPLTAITIPASVTSIGIGAFQYAYALTSMTIPEGVTSIGVAAFFGATALTTVTVPASVISIGDIAFAESPKLSRIYFLGHAPNDVGVDSFSGIQTSATAYITATADRFDLDDSGKWNRLAVMVDGTYECSTGVITTSQTPTETPTYTITAGAVSAGTSCAGDVVIAAGVRSIEHHAFSGAQYITSITFTDDGMLTDIGVHAFEWIVSLTSITIPASVTSIGAGAFFGDTSLTSMFFLGDDPSPGGDIFWASQLGGYASATKAYFRTGATGFLQDSNGKWNGVPISPFYILTFEDTDSESGSVPSPIFSGAGESVIIPDNTGGLTKSGYDFAGWVSGIDTSGASTSYGPGAVGPMVGFDATLYVAWSDTNTNVPAVESYECSTGDPITNTTPGNTPTYKINDGVVSAGSSCVGAVVIPASVTTIGKYAFVNAILLNSVTFEVGSQLGTISEFAFYGTTSLKLITIPASVTSIGNQAFDTASSLTSVTFEVGSLLTSIGDSAFFGAAQLGSITIPASVETIGASAFANATLLESITFTSGSRLTSIGEGAFFGAAQLGSITIPASVETIGAYSFYNAAILISITIGAGVETIGESAFANATLLESITFTSGSLLTSIGEDAFFGAAQLGSITIPASVETIGNGAFANATSLDSITFSEGSLLTSIGDGAFTEATSLTTITIPANVTSIGDFAFVGATALSKIYFLGISLNSVGYRAFANINPPPKAYVTPTATGFMPDETGYWNGLLVVRIADGSYECSTGTKTTAGTSTYVITDGAVSVGSTCTGDVDIPSGVTSIGNEAFLNSELTSITIPNGVTSIGYSAFESTSNLSSISIPVSVLSIGGYAFWDSTALGSITVAGENPNYSSLNGVLFDKDQTTLIAYPIGNLATTYSSMPTTVKTIGHDAFAFAPNLSTITIPASVTSIGSFAFGVASKLSNIHFLGTAPAADQVGDNAFTNIGPSPKAYVTPTAAAGFALDEADKWNGLTVEIVDPPVVDPPAPTVNPYVVTYNSSRGSATKAGSFVAGGRIAKAPVSPKRTGYTFAGWSATSAGSTIKFPYTPGVSRNITLYAKWTKNVKALAKVKPTINGVVKVGKSLTANKGTWTGSPKPTHSYQWYVCTKKVAAATSKIPSPCKKIPKATKSTFKLVKAQKNRYITVLVTGTSTGTTKTTWMSKSTGKVG